MSDQKQPDEKQPDPDRLDADERRALSSWAAPEPPADFASRIVAMGRPQVQQAQRHGRDRDRADARGRARRRRVIAGLAAGALAVAGGGGLLGAAMSGTSGATMFSVYLACLAFGGILLVASLFGGHGDHGGDVGGHDVDHGGGAGEHDAGHDSAHHPSQGKAAAATPGYMPFLSLRFWIFAITFFGLTGALLEGLHLAPSAVVPLLAAGLGLGAGYAAARVFQALTRDTVGELEGPESHIGREGWLLLPTAPGQHGKVRFTAHGGYVDVVAETDGPEALPAGTPVLIVGMRGVVAVVERSPTSRPPSGPGSKEEESR